MNKIAPMMPSIPKSLKVKVVKLIIFSLLYLPNGLRPAPAGFAGVPADWGGPSHETEDCHRSEPAQKTRTQSAQHLSRLLYAGGPAFLPRRSLPRLLFTGVAGVHALLGGKVLEWKVDFFGDFINTPTLKEPSF
jgi:hypothetical protein